jgi:hypothetical protein
MSHLITSRDPMYYNRPFFREELLIGQVQTGVLDKVKIMQRTWDDKVNSVVIS